MPCKNQDRARVPELRAVVRGTRTHQQSWEPPGSSCCSSLLAGGFWQATHSGPPGGTHYSNFINVCSCDGDIKAVFEADLIGSFERTRTHGIRWKGFSPEGILDEVDLSVPSEERTRALRQEVNYMVAHSLHRHSESLVKLSSALRFAWFRRS